MKRKISYQWIQGIRIQEPRSMGFHKEKKGKSIDYGLVRLKVKIRCVRAKIKIYSDESKNGYGIGDYIRSDKRGNLEAYKNILNEGYTTLVVRRDEL
jgi:hypothetical protein